MFEDRWSVVSWPTEYGGRDLGIFEWLVFEEEYYRARAPKRVSQNGIFLLAPTMLEYGTEAQKARYLPPMAAGDEIWCQGWSEPDAGSDLAGIRSPRRAHRGGRRLGPQRAEDVGQPGRVRRVVLRHLPHRPRGRAPSRPDLFPHRHGRAGRHRAAHPPDRRRDRLRRDLLRQRRGPRGPGARRGRRGLVGRHGHRRLRARTLAAQPGSLHRGSRPPRPALRGARRPGRFRRRRGPGPHAGRGLQAPHLLDGDQGRPRARRRTRGQLQQDLLVRDRRGHPHRGPRPARPRGRAARGRRARRVARRLPLLAGRADLRRHQRDPAQRGGRAPARPAPAERDRPWTSPSPSSRTSCATACARCSTPSAPPTRCAPSSWPTGRPGRAGRRTAGPSWPSSARPRWSSPRPPAVSA